MWRAQGLGRREGVGEDMTGLGGLGFQNFGFFFLGWLVVEVALLGAPCGFFFKWSLD